MVEIGLKSGKTYKIRSNFDAVKKFLDESRDMIFVVFNSTNMAGDNKKISIRYSEIENFTEL